MHSGGWAGMVWQAWCVLPGGCVRERSLHTTLPFCCRSHSKPLAFIPRSAHPHCARPPADVHGGHPRPSPSDTSLEEQAGAEAGAEAPAPASPQAQAPRLSDLT